MPHVLISIGTNHRRVASLARGMAALRQQTDVVAVSRWYASTAVGFEAAPYWNAMIHAATTLPADALKHMLRDIEAQTGRVRVDAAGRRSRVVTLDLDIVSVDDVPAVPDLFTLAHLVVPLADIAPDALNPLTNRNAAYHAAWLRELAVMLPQLAAG